MCYNLPQVPSIQRRMNAGNTQKMLVELVRDESLKHFSFFWSSLAQFQIPATFHPSLTSLSAYTAMELSQDPEEKGPCKNNENQGASSLYTSLCSGPEYDRRAHREGRVKRANGFEG